MGDQGRTSWEGAGVRGSEVEAGRQEEEAGRQVRAGAAGAGALASGAGVGARGGMGRNAAGARWV